jgi:hypothetical protein
LECDTRQRQQKSDLFRVAIQHSLHGRRCGGCVYGFIGVHPIGFAYALDDGAMPETLAYVSLESKCSQSAATVYRV